MEQRMQSIQLSHSAIRWQQYNRWYERMEARQLQAASRWGSGDARRFVGNPQQSVVEVEASWNVMEHPQKPGFVFWRNGRVHLNRRGASVQSTTGSRDARISGSNAGYTMFRGSEKGTGYPLHSPVSPSLPLPCVTVCHHVSNTVYVVGNLAGVKRRMVRINRETGDENNPTEYWEAWINNSRTEISKMWSIVTSG
jgi:hypothetical protein